MRVMLLREQRCGAGYQLTQQLTNISVSLSETLGKTVHDVGLLFIDQLRPGERIESPSAEPQQLLEEP